MSVSHVHSWCLSLLVGCFSVLATPVIAEVPSRGSLQSEQQSSGHQNVAEKQAGITVAEPVKPITRATTDPAGKSEAHVTPNTVHAENQSKPLQSTSSWFSVIFSLLGIVLLIFVLAWVTRRMLGHRAVGGKDFKVLAAMPMGARERVALVQVKDKQFLLGVTAHQITHLHTFDEFSETDEAASSDFMRTLQGVIGNKKESTHDL